MHPRLPRGYRHHGLTRNIDRGLSDDAIRRQRRAERAAARAIENEQRLADEAAQAAAADGALGFEGRAKAFTTLLHEALANGITLDVAIAPHFRASLSIKNPAGW